MSAIPEARTVEPSYILRTVTSSTPSSPILSVTVRINAWTYTYTGTTQRVSIAPNVCTMDGEALLAANKCVP